MKRALCSAFLLIILVGCSSIAGLQNDYYVTADAYIQIMTEINRNYSTGLIPQEKYEELLVNAGEAQKYLLLARSALDLGDKAGFNDALGRVSLQLIQLKSGGGVE